MAKVRGPWRVTHTVHRDRKNLFCLAPRAEHHIGTIISGSKGGIERFEGTVRVIEAAPDMYFLLVETLTLLDLHGFVQSQRAQELAQRIRSVVHDLGTGQG
jgi:hypothetical protein